jgi:hypothetical protein
MKFFTDIIANNFGMGLVVLAILIFAVISAYKASPTKKDRARLYLSFGFIYITVYSAWWTNEILVLGLPKELTVVRPLAITSAIMTTSLLATWTFISFAAWWKGGCSHLKGAAEGGIVGLPILGLFSGLVVGLLTGFITGSTNQSAGEVSAYMIGGGVGGLIGGFILGIFFGWLSEMEDPVQS